ncbi:SANT/Myb_domain [Hexamita inflata]|uniref:SANT/Myb domain n=1 Tax=Hexamita inflata TaxID=28002 RepID=A0AA86PUF7_9EUKA|nr:SANT/Myb domain [Hexamita inflata]
MPYQKWTEQQRQQFLKLEKLFGQDFEFIAQKMNMTYSQVRSHYFYNKRLNRKDKTIKSVIGNVLGQDSSDENKSQIDQSAVQYSFIIFDKLNLQ